MTTKKPQTLPSVDSRVYGLFSTKLARAKDSSNTKTTRKTDTSSKKWSEEEVQDQLQGVTEVITALSKVNGVQRLGQILDAKRNSKSRIDLATHLIHFIWTSRNENADILKYAAVVRLMRGIMEIGVDREDTPCLIGEKVPAADAEGLQDFKVSSVDASVWDHVEGPLKTAGISISKALALLPQHKVTAPVQQWQQLIEVCGLILRDMESCSCCLCRKLEMFMGVHTRSRALQKAMWCLPTHIAIMTTYNAKRWQVHHLSPGPLL